MRLVMSRVAIFLGVLSLSGCSLWVPIQQKPTTQTPSSGLPLAQISINSETLIVEVAATDQARAQGLSDRKSLPEDAGMLFLFDQPGRYSFWMNGMNFPLDFIWLTQGKVVEITENVPNPSPQNPKPTTIVPHQPIDAVIEVNAGWAAEYGVRLGNEVTGLP